MLVGVLVGITVGVFVGTVVAVASATCGWGVAVGVHDTMRLSRKIIAFAKRFIFPLA